MAEEQGRRVGATPAFRRVQAGDRPSASEQNRIIEAIRQLYAQIAPHARQIGVELIRLSQAIGPEEAEMSEFHKRSAVVQYYDPEQNVFQENAEETKQVTDPMGLVWDEDEIVPALFHHQSGQYLPLNPRTVRHAITWDDTGGTYPSNPANKYPIKFIRLEYDDHGAKMQTPTRVYLDSQSTSPGSNEPDDYVLNINRKAAEAYIKKYTHLLVYNCIGKNGDQQWFTTHCCTDDTSSTTLPSNPSSDQSSDISSDVSSDISSDISSDQSSNSSGGSSGSSGDMSSGASSGSSGMSSGGSSGMSSGGSSGMSSGGSSGDVSGPSNSLFSGPDMSGVAGTCVGNCVFVWDGVQWNQTSWCFEYEPVECYSCGPGSSGTFVGEVYSQACEAAPFGP